MIYRQRQESPPSLLSLLDSSSSPELQQSPEAPNLYSGAQELVEIDIKNCQPLILAKIAADRFGTRLPADVEEWTDLAQGGHLYETIRDRLLSGRFAAVEVSGGGKTWRDDPLKCTRNKAKKQLITAMFASTDVAERMLVWRLIANDWPNIAAVANEIKRRGNGHEELAKECQRIESSLVIDGVCGHLAEHHSDLPTLTIHDCVIVPRYAQSLIEDLIREYFGRNGMRPKLDSSDLNKEAA
jgi:hypothetical protein